MEKHATVRKDGKRVVKEKLSLPGYVLVQANMTPDVASTLRFMPNVLGFLGGMSEPSPVRQADINRLLGNVEDTELEEVQNVPYMVGETVQVTDGPFSGFHGIIEEVNAEKHKTEGDGDDFWSSKSIGTKFYASRKRGIVLLRILFNL